MVVIITHELDARYSYYVDILRERGLSVIQHRVADNIKDYGAINRVVDMILERKSDYTLFMSVTSVKILVDALRSRGIEPSIINDSRVVAVGPVTAEELLKNGIRVDLIPERYSSYGLLDMFKNMEMDSCNGKSILIPRSKEASSILADGLKSLGMLVYEEYIYRLVPVPDGWSSIVNSFVSNDVSAVIFTSSMIANIFIDTLSHYMSNASVIDALKNVICIAIGPLTCQTLLAYDVDAYTADEHTVEGALKLLLSLLAYTDDTA